MAGGVLDGVRRSIRANPGDADVDCCPQSLGQLPGVVLEMANDVKVEFQLVERQPTEA
jgi:hypothetical protein